MALLLHLRHLGPRPQPLLHRRNPLTLRLSLFRLLAPPRLMALPSPRYAFSWTFSLVLLHQYTMPCRVCCCVASSLWIFCAVLLWTCLMTRSTGTSAVFVPLVWSEPAALLRPAPPTPELACERLVQPPFERPHSQPVCLTLTVASSMSCGCPILCTSAPATYCHWWPAAAGSSFWRTPSLACCGWIPKLWHGSERLPLLALPLQPAIMVWMPTNTGSSGQTDLVLPHLHPPART